MSHCQRKIVDSEIKNIMKTFHSLSVCIRWGGGGGGARSLFLGVFVLLQGATQAMKVEKDDVRVEQI